MHVGPLFPRYLFIRFDPGRDAWRRIYRTPGIAGLIAETTARPTAVPVGVVEGLIERMSARRIVDDPGVAAEVTEGGRGRIVEGRWSGWEGVCTLSRPARVKLLLSLFGREVAVELPRNAVLPV